MPVSVVCAGDLTQTHNDATDQIEFEGDKKNWVIADLVENKLLREGQVPCAGVAECARGKTVAQCTTAIWPAGQLKPANCNCGRAIQNWMAPLPLWREVTAIDVYRLTLPKKEAPKLLFLEAGSKSSHGLLRRN